MDEERPLDLVYFASVDWDYTFQRPQQLAGRLSRHGRVLYVNPLGLRAPRARDIARIGPRIAARLGQRAEELPVGLTVCAPLAYLPFPGSPWAARVNGRLLARAVERWRERFGVRDPWLLVGTPSPAVLAAHAAMRERLLVYDCLDDFALFHGGRPAIAETERALAERAEMVLATSMDLREKMARINPRTLLVPNACDYDHFAKAADTQPEPEPLAGLPRPIFGYCGEISDWLDAEAVRALALGEPAASVVLIGPLHGRGPQPLAGLRNVHCLGRRAYAQLPEYFSHFDVCLLPFQVSPWTSAVNPVKLYEYLATGKPVVSTPLKEVLPYRDVVRIAEGRDLVGAVRGALESRGDREAAERRMAVARENTWDRRIDQILESLRGLQAARASGRRAH